MTGGVSARPTGSLDRDTIVAAASDLVDGIGSEELTLTAIADRLGVTQPALYRHVENLADVWRLLGLATRAELAAVLTEASVGLAGREAVEAIAHAWRRYGNEHPGRYLSAGRHAVEGDAELVAAAHRTIGVLERVLTAYGLEADARRDAADTMRSAFHGFVSYEIGHGHPDPDRLDASFDRLIHHLTVAFEAERRLAPVATDRRASANTATRPTSTTPPTRSTGPTSALPKETM